MRNTERFGVWESLSERTFLVLVFINICPSGVFFIMDKTCFFKVIVEPAIYGSLSVLFSLNVHSQLMFAEKSFSCKRPSLPCFFSLHPQQHCVIMKQQHLSGMISAKTGKHHNTNMRTAESNDSFLKYFIVVMVQCQ